MIKKFSVFFFI